MRSALLKKKGELKADNKKRQSKTEPTKKWKMEARIMRYNTTQVIFLSKVNNILTELQSDMVRLLVMPSLRKGKTYHE